MDFVNQSMEIKPDDLSSRNDRSSPSSTSSCIDIDRPTPSSTSAVVAKKIYHGVTNTKDDGFNSSASLAEHHSIETRRNFVPHRRTEMQSFTLDQVTSDNVRNECDEIIDDVKNTSTLLSNGFVSMREQDAELLESMQLINCDSIQTPILTSRSHSSSVELLDTIPDFSLEQQQQQQTGGSETSENQITIDNSIKASSKHHRRIRTGTNVSILLPSTPTVIPPATAESDVLGHSVNHRSTSIPRPLSKSLLRKALSGEIWTSTRNLGDSSVPDSILSSPSSSNAGGELPLLQQLNLASSSSVSSFKRSISTDRFLCEAAQFAEAIGEDLTKNHDLQIIDDDDRDLSDDDEVDAHLLHEDRDDDNDLLEDTKKVTENQVVIEEQQHPRKWDSNDRRVSEVVQFAEAVGEFDVALKGDPNNTIQIIDNDDDEDARFEDEDDVNIGMKVTSQQTSQRQVPGSEVSTSFSSIREHELERTDSLLKTASVTYNIPHALMPPKPIPQHRARGSFGSSGKAFLDKLPDDYNSAPATAKQLDFVYKGIKSNPPEIVKRGITRGNYAQLHRKAWLEVSDKYHRYGKNLRLYYRYWESLSFPTNVFLDWLDSKGESAGQPLPEIEECPRSKLDSDTVLYVTNPQVTESYKINFIPTTSTFPVANVSAADIPTSSTAESTNESSRSSIVEAHAEIAQSQSVILQNQLLRKGVVMDCEGNPVLTGPDGWIFVLRDNEMYGAPKVTSVTTTSQQTSPPTRQQRFHHSSFFGGKAVAAAGIFITDDEGILTRLYPHSGHYRPGEAHMQRVLFYLYHKGIDLRTFEMDIQQILHVARGGDQLVKDKKKKEKNDSPSPNEMTDAKSPKSPSIRKRDKMIDATSTSTINDPDNNNNSKDVLTTTTEKKKKVESLHLLPAILVACFLAHKARFVGEGIFSQIHKIRRRGKEITNVTEALNIIDDGGCFWSSAASAAATDGNTSQHNNNASTTGTSSSSKCERDESNVSSIVENNE